MNRLDDPNLKPVVFEDRPQFLEIDTARGKRLWGVAAYILFYLVVAGALVLVFLQFTPSFALATGLVVFMTAYMALMGWLVTRNLERRGWIDRTHRQ